MIVTGDDDDDDDDDEDTHTIHIIIETFVNPKEKKMIQKQKFHTNKYSSSRKIIFIICDETEHQSQLFINSK